MKIETPNTFSKTLLVTRYSLRGTRGFASLVSILLIFVIAVFVTSLLVLSALTDERISRDTLNSTRSLATAESGLEDRMLRITSSKQYPSSGTLALNGGVATVLTGSSGKIG